MIIDSHQHAFWHRRDDAGLIADMDEHGIDLAWLLTWEIPPGQENPAERYALNPAHACADGSLPGVILGDLILARDRYPQRFVLGYCPDPATGSAAVLFESAYHMHGVRVCGEWKFRMCFDDPRCIELFRMAGRLGCPVVLHLDVPWLPDGRGETVYQPLWFGGTVENLERALRACPGTSFIGHAPGFWREISGDADQSPSIAPAGPVVPGGRIQRLFDVYPNLYADLSAGSGRHALQRDPAHARQFIERYAERLLFGRDTYGGQTMTFLRGLGLADGTIRKIFSENAMRLASVPGSLRRS